MPHQLTFKRRHKYNHSAQGITLEDILRHGNLFSHCQASVDTGAQICLFAREIGEDLELDIEAGSPMILETLTGNFVAYGHELTLDLLETQFYSTVYFAVEKSLRRNLLGREGWLHLIRLALIDYDEELYLSLYNDPN